MIMFAYDNGDNVYRRIIDKFVKSIEEIADKADSNKEKNDEEEISCIFQAERNAKDSRPRWVFDFLDIFVSDAAQPSEEFDEWPGHRQSRLRWLNKQIQMTIFGWSKPSGRLKEMAPKYWRKHSFY